VSVRVRLSMRLRKRVGKNDRRYRILRRFTIWDARARDHRRAAQWAVVLLVAFSRIGAVRLPASIIRKRSREHARRACRNIEKILCRGIATDRTYTSHAKDRSGFLFFFFSFLLRQYPRSTSVGPPGWKYSTILKCFYWRMNYISSSYWSVSHCVKYSKQLRSYIRNVTFWLTFARNWKSLCIFCSQKVAK